MKTGVFVSTVIAVVLFNLQAFASSASLIINRDILVNKANGFDYIFEADLGKPKCKLEVSATHPTLIKAKTEFVGEVSVWEKYVWQDADNVDRSAMTQVIFKSNDNTVSVTSACFTHGFIFPAAGLPTVKELLVKARPYYSLR